MSTASIAKPTWVRSGVLAGAAELMRELGADPAAVAQASGLDPAALEVPDLPVPGAAVIGFFEAAAAATACEDFGIRLASRQDLSVLGPLWMTMRSAQTVLDALRNNYDMKAHTRGDSRQATTLTDDFVDRFAVVGPPDRCIERLRELKALGLDKVAISGATRGASVEDAAVGRELLVKHVLPGMHA